jgi:hypothetical protein
VSEIIVAKKPGGASNRANGEIGGFRLALLEIIKGDPFGSLEIMRHSPDDREIGSCDPLDFSRLAMLRAFMPRASIWCSDRH